MSAAQFYQFAPNVHELRLLAASQQCAGFSAIRILAASPPWAFGVLLFFLGTRTVTVSAASPPYTHLGATLPETLTTHRAVPVSTRYAAATHTTAGCGEVRGAGGGAGGGR